MATDAIFVSDCGKRGISMNLPGLKLLGRWRPAGTHQENNRPRKLSYWTCHYAMSSYSCSTLTVEDGQLLVVMYQFTNVLGSHLDSEFSLSSLKSASSNIHSILPWLAYWQINLWDTNFEASTFTDIYIKKLV